MIDYAFRAVGYSVHSGIRCAYEESRGTNTLSEQMCEAVWCQLSVAHGVLDVLVAEIILDETGVGSAISQVVAASVAEHVRMNL